MDVTGFVVASLRDTWSLVSRGASSSDQRCCPRRSDQHHVVPRYGDRYAEYPLCVRDLDRLQARSSGAMPPARLG
ncbi:hypothetical protein FRACA_810005 [Frankia canadensis]|uniref:Uncharacterized protein n=1 Tax=Frankia canadensis TaxID=1836972 RepID=A0A2I2L1M0_9ACTN|nr:hypothetical protein FRACA_810005 [Frankia canadensis]SOU59104.1 hypothetical protein FRACA_810005 [Frankia canadensis]